MATPRSTTSSGSSASAASTRRRRSTTTSCWPTSASTCWACRGRIEVLRGFSGWPHGDVATPHDHARGDDCVRAPVRSPAVSPRRRGGAHEHLWRVDRQRLAHRGGHDAPAVGRAAEGRRLARLAGLGRAALAQAGAPRRHAARALHDRGRDPLAQQARSRRAQDVHGDGEPARRGRADDARARDVRPPALRLMRAAAALAALLVLVPSTAAAAARAIVLTTLFGEYHLVFDDARITEAEVRDLVVLSS